MPWSLQLSVEQHELWVRRVATSSSYRPLPHSVLDATTRANLLERMGVGALVVQSPMRAARNSRQVVTSPEPHRDPDPMVSQPSPYAKAQCVLRTTPDGSGRQRNHTDADPVPTRAPDR